LNPDNNKEQSDDKNVMEQICSMLGLPSGILGEVTLDLGPLASPDGTSAVSWCDEEFVHEYNVFVKYENEDGLLGQQMGEQQAADLLKRGPLMVCMVLRFPPEVIPHQDILDAARFAEGTAPGEVAQFSNDNEDHRKLCVGGPIAFQVGHHRHPAFWSPGQIVKLPLITGVSIPTKSAEADEVRRGTTDD